MKKNYFEKESKRLLFSNILTICVRKHIYTYSREKIIYKLQLMQDLIQTILYNLIRIVSSQNPPEK